MFKIRLFICIAIILYIAFLVFLLMPRIMPTNSSARNLTIVKYNGRDFSNYPVITLSQDFLNHSVEHILEIELCQLEPQTYKLPHLQEGNVTVNLLGVDWINSSFTLEYENAIKLRQDGLLIYLAIFNDEYYVYFVSGSSEICYSRPRNGDEWTLNTNPPRRRAIEPDYSDSGFIVIPSDWKSNQWVTSEYSYP